MVKDGRGMLFVTRSPPPGTNKPALNQMVRIQKRRLIGIAFGDIGGWAKG